MVLNCGVCSKEFHAKPYALKRGRGKFCSRECSDKGRNKWTPRKPYQLAAVNRGWFKGRPPVELTCVRCNKRFMCPAAHAHRVKHCSYACYWGFPAGNPIKRDRIRGAMNRHARTSIEHKRWSAAVKKRDNHTCQLCGTTEGRMEADHIKGFAAFPELRYELSNGRTLCILCHRQRAA